MMSSASVKTAPGQSFHLLNELQSLLNEQIKLVRKGDFSTSETLTEGTGRLVNELGQTGVSEHPEFGLFSNLLLVCRKEGAAWNSSSRS